MFCSATYIGETMQNVSIRQTEHEKLSWPSGPVCHKASKPDHTFI